MAGPGPQNRDSICFHSKSLSPFSECSQTVLSTVIQYGYMGHELLPVCPEG